MAFTLRRPFAVASALKQITKPAAAPLRNFSQAPLRAQFQQSQKRVASKSSVFSQSKSVFQSTFRRNISQDAPAGLNPGGNLTQRLLYGAGIFGGTLVAINLVFNRETREDGGMPPFERSYLNDTFLHTGLGLGIIAVAARALHTSGWSYKLMSASPWVLIGVGLAGSIGTMMGTMATAPEK